MREIRESGDKNEVRRGGFEVLLPVACCLVFSKNEEKNKKRIVLVFDWR
jgi:hypothetical protein